MTIDDPHGRTSGASTTDSITSEAADQASRLAGSVRDEVTRREQDLRSGLADRAESVAAGLRKAGSEIDPDSTVATMFDRAADSVSGLADSLASTDPAQLVDDVRGFARRQPGAFLGLSALAGFAAIRFLRAGSTTSSAPMNTSGFGNSGMVHGTSTDDHTPVSPAGTAATARPTSNTPGTPAASARPASSGAPTFPGGRNIGGSHD